MAPSKATESFSFAVSLFDSTIQTWNSKCAEVLQYSKEDAIHANWHEKLLPPEWHAQIMTWIEEKKILEQDSSQFNLPLVAKNGERCVSKILTQLRTPGYAFFVCVGHTPLGQCPMDAGESLVNLNNAFPIIEREVPGAGIATFSSQKFEAGAVIFEEEPFVFRLKPADVQKRRDWNASWVSAFEAIKAPMCFPGADSKSESMLYASMALVRDALTFVKAPEATRNAILSLSNPPLTLENGLVSIALQIAELCHDRLTDCADFAVDVLQRAILVFEVNTFPGGRMFWTMSRINHSCAPNALFIASPGKCYLKALRHIEAGEEINISYFNEELLYPTYQRQWLLWRSKCFLCQCTRCVKNADVLRCRPCNSCTTRGLMHKQWKVVHSPGAFCRATPSTKASFVEFMRTDAIVEVSGEEIETEEGRWLKLEGGKRWMLTHGEKVGFGPLLAPVLSGPVIKKVYPEVGPLCAMHADFTRHALDQLDDFNGVWYDRQSLASVKIPNAIVLATSPPAAEETDIYMSYQDGCWTCLNCGRVEDDKNLLEVERRLSHLAQKTFKIDLSEQRKLSAPDGFAALVDDEFVTRGLSLADDVLAVCGPRHWAWNWGLVFLIDFELSLLSYCNFGAGSTAICDRVIKTILDVWDWLASLDITHDPSYYLHTRAVKALRVCSGAAPSVMELQRRVDGFTPFADCLGQRSFLPSSRVSGA